MSQGQSAIASYCNAMEEIKTRMAHIQRVTKGYSPFGREDFDGESIFMLMRKALETMAFASLTAHREAYATVFDDASTQWRAKRLIERLGQIHPDFYPKPVHIGEKDERGVIQMKNIEDGFLTPDEFVFLYDKCSEVIHTRNPLRGGDNTVYARRSIYDWTLRIVKLLGQHVIRLHGSADVWLVQLQREDDGRVHAYMCPAIGEDKGQPTADLPIPKG